jgi:hypothetical protein
MTASGESGVRDGASGEDLLEAIGLATGLRVSAPAAPERTAYSREVMLLFSQLVAVAPQLSIIAQAVIRPGLECALNEGRQVLASIQTDPAAPGLEANYYAVLQELSGLAPVFVDDFMLFANDNWPPAEEYLRLTAAVDELLLAAGIAKPVWQILRRGVLARRKPPARPKCTEPHADPKEYYM